MDEFDESPPVSRPKLSKTPSWIMLGFLLGAFFVMTMNNRPGRAGAPTPPPAPPPKAAAPLVPAPPPRLSDVEAYFEQWGKQHALWANDVTYVVAWDIPSSTYRDAFEVIQVGDKRYFRSVPRPRGMRVREGVPRESPLQFLIPVAETRAGIFGVPAEPPPTGGTP